MRYPLHRLQVIKGSTLSSSTFDCLGVVDFSAAFFALFDAFNVAADFGGLPFLRFGGGGGGCGVTATTATAAAPEAVEGASTATKEACLVEPFPTTAVDFERIVDGKLSVSPSVVVVI